MALLASSWLLVESFVIPNGFLKWFYLSFYIHTFFLVFCQIFLWLNELKKLLISFFYPFTALSLFIFRIIHSAVFSFSFSFWCLFPKDDLIHDAFETQIVVLSKCVEEEKAHEICVKDSWLNEYLNSSYDTVSMEESVVDSQSSEGTQDSVLNSSDPLLLEDILLPISQDGRVSPSSRSVSNDYSLPEGAGVPADHQFHHDYTSRVRFFDALYRERLQGMNAIWKQQLSSPGVEPWGRRAGKMVVRSLESDLEMISVAQCWLFWEALDYQYHKVESYGNIVFHHDISGKFEELEIVLGRFVEEECHLLSSSKNASKRLSFQALLHVPDVTGFVVVMKEEEKMMGEEYWIDSSKLLQVIQKCVNAFWLYIKTHENKPFWKYKAIYRTTYPPVEDPRDLKLLYDVVNNLHKKGIMLRSEEGKSKCWMRRKVRAVEAEHEKRNLLVAMIDMKLVQRMLKMSSISRAHLQWCREKLDKIEFRRDGVFRGRITRSFPLP